MRGLVVTASKHGATAEIGQAVGEALTEHGLDSGAVDAASDADVASYEAVVIGSAVYAGHWLSAAVEFVQTNQALLRDRKVWLFSSGPVGDPPKPDEEPVDVASMMEMTGAEDHQIFAGRLDKSQLSFGEKALVVALRAPTGDFRDWDGIRSWAVGIAEEMLGRDG